MSKTADAAAIAASVKKSNTDAAAMGSPEFAGAMENHGVVRLDGTSVVRVGRGWRGSREARNLVAANLGKKRHRRGWCAL
jgi:hypothetical protein